MSVWYICMWYSSLEQNILTWYCSLDVVYTRQTILVFLSINNERNSKIYLFQKEDNTILGPNITINFKIIQNMLFTRYERIYVSKLQRLTAEPVGYKRLQIDNNKLLTINTYITIQSKLHCSL
jgi:hypothetical protein